MNGVLIIPTGIGASIGGHAGDANPVCKLLASCCDTLITHPNVVNASDINEMPENVLYVEGSQLDMFVNGEINLEPVRTYNRILVVCNSPITAYTIHAVNAAKVTIGADIRIMELKTPLIMEAYIEDGQATGKIEGIDSLCDQIRRDDYDALAVHTPIIVNRGLALSYFREGGVNPWGGIEAQLSKIIAKVIRKPIAHAPIESTNNNDIKTIFEMESNPRMAPEVISNCYFHSVLKGLHRAPGIISPKHKGIMRTDIDWIISPYGCWGKIHHRAYMARIPVIMVKENTTCLNNHAPNDCLEVENYWEAAGYIMAMKAGVKPSSVRL